MQYKVKSNPGNETYMTILSETEEQLWVRLLTIKDGYEVEKKEILPRKLFDACLRTGFLTPLALAETAIRKTA